VPLSVALSFVYRPLNISENEICLLRIAPSSEISCLIRGTLNHHSSYEALTYTWVNDRVDDAEYRSDRDPDHFILLYGHYFPLARNLFASLRQLRLSSKKRRLFWVNAICINHKRSCRAQRISQYNEGDICRRDESSVTDWRRIWK
jgi:hypothetical protein